MGESRPDGASYRERAKSAVADGLMSACLCAKALDATKWCEHNHAALDRLIALVEAEAEHSAAPHYDRECSDKYSLCWQLREARQAIEEAE